MNVDVNAVRILTCVVVRLITYGECLYWIFLSFLDRVRGRRAVNSVGAGVSRNVRQLGDRFQTVLGEEVSVGQAAA